MRRAAAPPVVGIKAKKQWGQKTAWAKHFFTLLPSAVNDSDNPSSSQSPLSPPLVPIAAHSASKEVKKLSLLPTTRWCCIRCGQQFVLPRDTTSGRPLISLLFDHLEKRVDGDKSSSNHNNVSDGKASHGKIHALNAGAVNGEGKGREEELILSSLQMPACTAGPICFSDGLVDAPGEDATAARLQSAAAGGTAAPVCLSINEKDAEAQLRALLQRLATSIVRHDECHGGDNSELRAPLVFIVVENPKTPANLGSILRAMGCMCSHTHTTVPPYPASGAQTCNDCSLAGAFLYTGSRLDKACQFPRSTGLGNESDVKSDMGATWEINRNDDVGSTDAQRAARTVPRLCLRSLHTLFDVLARFRTDTNPDSDSDVPSQSSDPNGAAKETNPAADIPIEAVTVAVDLIVGASPLPTYVHPFTLEDGGSTMTTTRRRMNRRKEDSIARKKPRCESSERSTGASAPDMDLNRQKKSNSHSSVRAVFYVFGPEDGSLSADYLARCDEALYMPTVGSLNLAASVNVVLYDRIAKDHRFLSKKTNFSLSPDSATSMSASPAAAVDVHEQANGAERYFIHRNSSNHLVWEGK